ncbi:MAG TPA: CTP synthase [Dehalococcoidia bacterium]|nr:CTP synthase [Dehalococcoidia bacterium]
MPKYIFVTGGVVSSVGKGITTASLGRILKSRGVCVSIQKLDPYLNVDPGTMSPYQHGEVFVTVDGAETDLDLGHYERFIDQDLTRASSVTTGQIYQAVISKERRGDYLGGTIQAVPHLTNEIKARIRAVAQAGETQVVIVEVGGTVGDIESQPFLEAIRQIRNEEAREDTLSIHVSFLPFVGASGELKTKPTQHSVRELRSMGIQPDVIVCRSDHPVPEELTAKVALFCDVEQRAVVPMVTADTIYRVPIMLEDAGLGDYVIERLQLPALGRDMAEWRAMVERLTCPEQLIEVAVVGKYVELRDAYMSVKESLIHAGAHHRAEVNVRWIQSESITAENVVDLLAGVDGIVVPGGFGERGIEGKILAARYARERKIPYLGLCLGMQVMVIEFARHIFRTDDVNSTEFAPGTAIPIISLLSEQTGVSEKGGTMRLGGYPCRLKPGTKAQAAYGEDVVVERHRHRYEFNNAYRHILEQEGLIASGVSPDGSLVEISELRDHPFMLGSQFHPELRSRPNRPHPLFRDFVGAACSRAASAAQHAHGAAQEPALQVLSGVAPEPAVASLS